MIKQLSSNSVKLCCNKRGCPIVTDIGNGMVEITDDDGNKVIMKKEEALLLSDGVKILEGNQLILG